MTLSLPQPCRGVACVLAHDNTDVFSLALFWFVPSGKLLQQLDMVI